MNDVIKLIIFNLGCHEISYKTICSFEVVNKYWYKFIKSNEFNYIFSKIYNCDVNSFKLAREKINNIVNNYSPNYDSLIMLLDRKYINLYKKFGLDEHILMAYIKIGRLKLTYNDQAKQWSIYLYTAGNCYNRAYKFCTSEDLYIPLHYILYNKLDVRCD